MTTTQLYKEITRLAQEGQLFPLLATKRAKQIAALYRQIASLKASQV